MLADLVFAANYVNTHLVHQRIYGGGSAIPRRIWNWCFHMYLVADLKFYVYSLANWVFQGVIGCRSAISTCKCLQIRCIQVHIVAELQFQGVYCLRIWCFRLIMAAVLVSSGLYAGPSASYMCIYDLHFKVCKRADLVFPDVHGCRSAYSTCNHLHIRRFQLNMAVDV
jgi:hypothetical protein